MSEDSFCAIVTGAASGLGAATAIGLADTGARLILNYLSNRDGAEEIAETCRMAGAEAVVVQGDVASDDDCRRIAAAAESFGGLNALVNNAGTTKHVPHGELDRLTAEDFHRIYAVNTLGAYQMIRAARPLLEAGAKSWGIASAVVNVSSIAGISGVGSSIAYVASKGALNAMTLALARALAPSIRVNAVCPGYMDTPWFEKGLGAAAADQIRERVESGMPLKLAPTGEDIAELVCFLATPKSLSMTGEIVRMDAGYHLVTAPG
jgi:NAD(P)-dependent dehydrogenase (short-subunit alcohol dehydrogenase family)